MARDLSVVGATVVLGGLVLLFCWWYRRRTDELEDVENEADENLQDVHEEEAEVHDLEHDDESANSMTTEVPGDWVPYLRRPVAASQSSVSGQSRSEPSERTYGRQSRHGLSIPSGQARSADRNEPVADDLGSELMASSDADGPVADDGLQVNGAESGRQEAAAGTEGGTTVLGAEGGTTLDTRLARSTAAPSTEIVGLTYHLGTDRHYLLMKTGTKYFVSRLQAGDFRESLSFNISREESEGHSGEGVDRILISGDFIIVCSTKCIISFSLDGERKNEVQISPEVEVADFAATDGRVYCLHKNGQVYVFNVPEQEHIDSVRPSAHHDSILEGICISCGSNERIAISSGSISKPGQRELKDEIAANFGVVVKEDAELEIYSSMFRLHNAIAVDHITVIVYDRNWTCNRTIAIPGGIFNRPCIELIGDEEIVAGGKYDALHYLHYGRGLSANVEVDVNDWDANLNLTAVCDTCMEYFSVSWSSEAKILDLDPIRKGATPCVQMDGSLIVKFTPITIPYQYTRHHLPLRQVTVYGGFVQVNKRSTDQLLVLASNMMTYEYNSNDLTRPLESRQLLPKRFIEDSDYIVKGFDVNEDGEVAVIFENHLLIWFGHDRVSITSVEGPIRDVFWHGSDVYLLMEEELQILNIQALADEPRRVPLTLPDVSDADREMHHESWRHPNPQWRWLCDRMVHHENIVFIFVSWNDGNHSVPKPGKFFIYKMDLSHDQPSNVIFLSLPYADSWDMHIAVDENGRFIMYRSSVYRSGDTVDVYSPGGELVKREPINRPYADSLVRDIASCPSGGLYILESTGLRHIEI